MKVWNFVLQKEKVGMVEQSLWKHGALMFRKSGRQPFPALSTADSELLEAIEESKDSGPNW